MDFLNTVSLIWAADCPREFDQYVAFRRSFKTAQDGLCRIRIFADTYYNLYVDGEFIHRGPVRRHEHSAEYDVLECSLKKGSHTVAVLAHWLGKECAGHRKGAAALWCRMDGCGVDVVTDSSWKAKFCDGFHSDGKIISHFDYREEIDLRPMGMGWITPAYDDSAWPQALECGFPGGEQDVHANYHPRQMKLFSYQWETAQILKTGRYTETKPQDTYFFDRFSARTRGESGTDGSFAVAGFEMTVSGTVCVTYRGAKAGDELIIGYDDCLTEEGLPLPWRYMGYGDRFLLPEGDGTVEVLMPRGFWYVLVEASGTCRIETVRARKEIYPYSPKMLESSDSYWVTLYNQCVRTQHICTIDGYTDCVNRERVLWLGDAWLDCAGAYYSEPDLGLLLTTLQEHALGQVESGALGGYNSSDLQPEWLHMAPYNLMYLLMLCDYVQYTGREEDVLPLKETARGILRFVCGNRNEDGFFDTRYKGCSNFWDWGYPDAPGQSLKTNAFLIYTVERMAAFPVLRDLVEELLEDMQALKGKCFALFWDESRRVFHDGCLRGEAPDPLSTQLANALAVLSGICPESLRDEVLERMVDPQELDAVPTGAGVENEDYVIDKTKILPSGTMYSAHLVAMAMFEAKRCDLGLAYLREVWGPFADLPTLPELRFNGEVHTMCHGWSGGAAYLIPRYVLGLYPVQSGWQTACLEIPDVDPEQLSGMGTRMTVPQGELTVQWNHMGNTLRVCAILPEGVRLQVKWKNREWVLDSGTTVWLLN